MSKFTDCFEGNRSEPYPILMVGWPDAAHGIDWDRYQAWCDNCINNMEEGDDAPHLMTFSEWVFKQRENRPDRDNLGFERSRCDTCGALPGDHHAVTAYNHDLTDYIVLSVCNTCIMYIANGELPDED